MTESPLVSNLIKKTIKDFVQPLSDDADSAGGTDDER